MFWDKPEEIPGAHIIQREIVKAVSGKDFFINDEITGKPIELKAVAMEVFDYYYEIWENFHYFKILPLGKGWMNENPIILQITKAFIKAKTQVDNFLELKAIQKSKVQNG